MTTTTRIITINPAESESMVAAKADGPGYCVSEGSGSIRWFCTTKEDGKAYISRVRAGVQQEGRG